MAQFVGQHVSSHQEEKVLTTLTIEETRASPATLVAAQRSMPHYCSGALKSLGMVEIEEPVVSTAAFATEQRPVEEPIVPTLETHQR